MRGRLLSRHHLLSDPVVSGGLPRPRHQLLHAGNPDFLHRRGPYLRHAAQPEWEGIGRLAMAVHSRSVALDLGGTSRCCSISPIFRSRRAGCRKRRNCVAGERASNREEEQGESRTPLVVSGAHRYPHPTVRSGVLLSECGKLWSCLLSAYHHQELRGQRYPDRVFGHIAIYLRRHRHGLAPRALPTTPWSGKRPHRRGVAHGGDRDRDIRIGFESLPRSSALLCFAQIGVSAVPAMFSPSPASFLTGASAAAGIAAIRSLVTSRMAGPFAMGYLEGESANRPACSLMRHRWRCRRS